MRVRMIRPAYWTDADLHTRLTADVREFYVGLWMEADDAGFVTWDVDRLGADLYPFRSLRWRRDHLTRYLGELNGHVQLLTCGKHALIPKLKQYQHCPKPSYATQRAHDLCLHVAPREPTGDQVAPAQEVGSRKGSRKGMEARARANGASATGEPTEFELKVVRPA